MKEPARLESSLAGSFMAKVKSPLNTSYIGGVVDDQGSGRGIDDPSATLFDSPGLECAVNA